MKSLSMIGALLHALFNADTKTFPSFEGRRIEPGEIAEKIREELSSIAPEAAKAKEFVDVLAKAKESLDEAKEQTEYQDQKISRLLTIVAFLTAAAGVIFSRLVDSYPIDHATEWTHLNVLVYAAYLFFFTFVALVAGGALISFHATRSRFVWDATHGNLVQKDKLPKSQLFFQESVRCTPDNWAKAFSSVGDDGTNAKLMLESYKGYVVESYLVNAKIADKLRLLEPAQAILSFAIRALLIWLILVAILFIGVGRPENRARMEEQVSNEVQDEKRHADARYGNIVHDSHVENLGPDIVVNCGVSPTKQAPPSGHPPRRSSGCPVVPPATEPGK